MPNIDSERERNQVSLPLLALRWLAPCWLCAGLLLGGLARGETNDFRVILERNVFGLKPGPPIAPRGDSLPEPRADMLLTGLVEYDGSRQALFMVVEPGKSPRYFNLHEGQQNDWLEVKSIQIHEGTVTVVLRKPSVQLRTVGTELVLTLKANGIKQRTVGDNTGHPIRFR